MSGRLMPAGALTAAPQGAWYDHRARANREGPQSDKRKNCGGICWGFLFLLNSDFMQKGSNLTRAYFINVNGIPGFVLNYSIARELIKAEENKELVKVTKYTYVDL